MLRQSRSRETGDSREAGDGRRETGKMRKPSGCLTLREWPPEGSRFLPASRLPSPASRLSLVSRFPAVSRYRVRLNQIAPMVRTTVSTVNVIPKALLSLLRISTSRHTRVPATRADAREPLGGKCDDSLSLGQQPRGDLSHVGWLRGQERLADANDC